MLGRLAVIVVAAWAAPGVAVCEEDEADWRLELLREEKIDTDTDSLRKFREEFQVSDEGFREAVQNLGAEGFQEREAARREILRMGASALPLIRELPRPEDPEVRTRLAEIEEALRTRGRWPRENLLHYAVDSLLHERGAGEGAAPKQLVFAEFFRVDAPSLEGGYRRFGYQSKDGMKGSVSKGALRLDGSRGGDGDQSLTLTARELMDREEFPGAIEVEARLGGESGGQGAYHIGLSVGRLKAIYHPGYAGGGFRFERVDTHKYLRPNRGMEFTPAMDRFQTMTLAARKLADGQIELKAVVVSADGAKRYEDRIAVDAETIGPLDRIGLERSGRTGGDGVFEAVVVALETR